MLSNSHYWGAGCLIARSKAVVELWRCDGSFWLGFEIDRTLSTPEIVSSGWQDKLRAKESHDVFRDTGLDQRTSEISAKLLGSLTPPEISRKGISIKWT